MNLKLLLSILCVISIFHSCNKREVSPRFNHVMLYTENLEGTIKFYTSAFDLIVTNKLKKLKRTQEDGSISEAEVNIAFLKFANQDFVYEIAEIPNLSQTEIPGYNVFHHIGIDVKDINLVSDRILKAGGKVLRPEELVEAQGITTKHAFFTGPNRETIELMQVISGEF